MRRTDPSNHLTLADRVFKNWQGQGPGQIDITATPDDIGWAVFLLGQYVAGTHQGQPFRAYIYNVSRNAGEGLGIINILVEQ